MTYKGQPLDFFGICKAAGYPDEPLLHAAKKLLFAGKRGKKDKAQDVREAMQSCQRWLEENDGEPSNLVQYCHETSVDGNNRLLFCENGAGHSGPHSWEA